MSDNILNPETARHAERWLLPEMEATHRVSARVKAQSAGFRKTSAPSREDTESPRKLPRALSASRLEQLEQEARASGEQAGREQGYQQGYAEAQQAGRTLVADYQQRIEALLQSITLDVERQKQLLQRFLSELVTNICEQVCQRELQQQSNIEQVVSRALAALPMDESSVTVYVNAGDLSLLESASNLLESGWQLQSDEHIGPGECRVSSENSAIDFRLEQRLEQIVSEVFAKSTAGSGDAG